MCIVRRMLLLEQVDDLISTAAPLQTRMSGGEHEIDELLGGHVPARISGALCHCHARRNADKVTVGVHVVRNRGPLQRSSCIMITRCAHMSSNESTGDPPNHHHGFYASLRRSHQCCSAVKPRKMASCGRSKAAEAAQERSVKRAGRMLSHSAALRLNQSDAPPWGSGRAAPLRLEHHTNTIAIWWPSPATHRSALTRP